MDGAERDAARGRLHILDGIIDALGRMDEVNRLVRTSRDRVEARRSLQGEPFSYSEVVATHVLDLTVSRQTLAALAELRRERDQARDRLERSG